MYIRKLEAKPWSVRRWDEQELPNRVIHRRNPIQALEVGGQHQIQVMHDAYEMVSMTYVHRTLTVATSTSYQPSLVGRFNTESLTALAWMNVMQCITVQVFRSDQVIHAYRLGHVAIRLSIGMWDSNSTWLFHDHQRVKYRRPRLKGMMQSQGNCPSNGAIQSQPVSWAHTILQRMQGQLSTLTYESSHHTLIQQRSIEPVRTWQIALIISSPVRWPSHQFPSEGN